MSNKARKFKSKPNKFNRSNRRIYRFNRYGHLKRINSLAPETLERNIENVIELNNEPVDLATFLLSSPENDPNVVVVDDRGNEVNKDARQEAEQAMAQTAVNEVSMDVLANEEEKSFSSMRFLRSVKSSWRRNLHNLKEEGKSFFSKMRSHFAEKNPVRASSILTRYRSSIVSLQKTVESVSAQAKTPKIKILCNKYKRKFEMAATVSFAALIMACSNNKQQAPMQVMEAQPDSIEIVTDSIPTSIYEVPTDSTRVQSGDLKSTIKFLNNTIKDKDVSGYEYATQRLTDEVMEKYFPGKTRDEVLNAYRYVRSFYPNADKAEKLNVPEDLVTAARTAQALDQFFSGCDDKLPDNSDALFIEQVKGEYTIRATGVQSPCDEGKVLYTGKRYSAKKTTTVRHKAEAPVQETVVEDKVTPVVKQENSATDSVAVETQTNFEVAPSALQNDTVYSQPIVNDSVSVQEFTSNENLKAKKTDPATPADVLGLNTKDTKVAIETPQKSFVDVDNVSSSSGITEFKGNNLSDAQTVRDNVPADEVKNLKTASTPVDIENSAAASAQTSFVETPAYSYTSAAGAEANDSTKKAASIQQTAFVEEAPSYTYTATATADSLSNAGVTTTTFDVTADNTASGDSVTVKILADSDTISFGTPAAGYVAERGGFENRGLSKKDIDYARKKLGAETYEKIIAESPKEWFAKGGIAEGLTPDQFAYIVAVLAVTEPHGVPVTAIMKSINCGDTITSEATVKAAVDGVHKNKTRDGWTYSKRVYVERVNNNGCGKRLTLDKWRTRRQKPTTASGPKFPRYFEQRGVLPRQTAFEDAPSSLTIEYVQAVQQTPTFVTEFKSNEDLAPKKTATATAEQVLSLETKDTKVTVEDATSTVQQPQKRKAATQRKHDAKVAARYERQAKEAGLSGNMALDAHQEKGAEFIRSFLDKNKNVKAEDIINYQAAVRQAYIDAVQSRKA